MHSSRETCSILDAGERYSPSLGKLHHRDVTTLVRVSVREIVKGRERGDEIREIRPYLPLSLSSFPYAGGYLSKAGSLRKATGSAKMPRNYASPYPPPPAQSLLPPTTTTVLRPALPPTIVAVTSSACNSVALPP